MPPMNTLNTPDWLLNRTIKPASEQTRCIAVNLPPLALEALLEASERDGVSVSAIVRGLVENHFRDSIKSKQRKLHTYVEL